MPIKRSILSRLVRGKVTDRTDDPSALWLMNDAIYRREIIVRRGAKVVVSESIATPAATGTFGHASHSQVGGLLCLNDDVAYRLSGRTPFSASWSALGDRPSAPADAGHAIDLFNRFAVIGEEIVSAAGFVNGGAPVRWAGSLKAATSTGSVSTTAGSRVVTGVGTSWLTTAERGMYLYFSSTAGNGLYHRGFRIERVNSDTELVVDADPGYTVSGVAFTISPVGKVASPAGVFTSDAGGSYFPHALVTGSHQNRLVGAYTRELIPGSSGGKWHPHRIRWSALPHEIDGRGGVNKKHVGMDYWHPNAFIDVAPGVGGDEITGVVSIGNALLVLKETAVCAVRGVLATDGSDLGASVDVVTTGFGCIGRNAWDICERGVVFADSTGAYVSDGNSVSDLTQGSIREEWRDRGWQSSLCVSAVGNRVVFQDENNCYVYDFETGTWSTQSGFVYGRIVDVQASNGSPLYELGCLRFGNAAHDWAGDYSRQGARDPGSTTSPDFVISTHDITPGDDDIASAGRIQSIRVLASIAPVVAGATVLRVKARQASKIGTGSDSNIGEISPADSSERVYRLRANGVRHEGRFSIQIEQIGEVDTVRLSGLEIETSYGRRSHDS